MKRLLICEKPSVAETLALALQTGRDITRSIYKGVRYFRISDGNDEVIICSASGHLFELFSKGAKGRRQYPVWDHLWLPRKDRTVSRQIELIAMEAAKADEIYDACDFDPEGSLVAYMVLREACQGRDRIARRMQFSTLSRHELARAFEHAKAQLDYRLIEAGLCRHEVDWTYGVNLSRAITELALLDRVKYRNLTIGRVQGPTLDLIIEREKEILQFTPEPYWKIQATGLFGNSKIPLQYEKSHIASIEEAHTIVSECSRKEGIIARIDVATVRKAPPPPFNLLDLQLECYRLYGIRPYDTLRIAEQLYLEGRISYPRTSSQQLPPPDRLPSHTDASTIYPRIRKGLQVDSRPRESKSTKRISVRPSSSRNIPDR